MSQNTHFRHIIFFPGGYTHRIENVLPFATLSLCIPVYYIMRVVSRYGDSIAVKRCAEKFPQQEVLRRRLRATALYSKIIIILCEHYNNIHCNKWWLMDTG